MKEQSSFIAWDFANESANGTNEIWQMPYDSYPALSSFEGYVPPELTGTGNEQDPWLVHNASELGAIYHYDHSSFYRLETDINLAGIAWSTPPIRAFAGCFDGAGHTIRNLSVSDCNYLGLFCRIDPSGSVVNLGLEDVNITGLSSSDNLGGLCGFNDGGHISNCHVTGAVSGGDDSVNIGGLCGYSHNGIISNCYTNCSISGDANLGSLCGVSTGTINNCSAIGSVSGGYSSYYLGGLCGKNCGTIVDSNAASSVSGGDYSSYIGGLCGINYGTISDCSATGSVTGGNDAEDLGGLCGYSYRGTIASCHATGSVTGGSDAENLGGLCGRSYEGKIMNSYASGSATAGNNSYCVGGLCGYNYQGKINDCYATGSVTGKDRLGGLCGWNEEGSISNCYAAGFVAGDWSCSVGGLCGLNAGSISNSYATGSVSALAEASVRLGGLCGGNWGSIRNCWANCPVSGGDFCSDIGGLCGDNSGSILDCHSSGPVLSGDYSSDVGGLCGYNYVGTITNSYVIGEVTVGDGSEDIGAVVGYHNRGSYSSCFWDVNVNPDMNGIGNTSDPNVIGKPTAQMQIKSTFANAGWDFISETVNGANDVWRLCWDGNWYPRLASQFQKWADLVCPDRVDLKDFSYLAARYGQTNCDDRNNCDGADLDYSGIVDHNDLMIFTDLWLSGRPAPGEMTVPPRVDFADYAELSGRWLNEKCWLTHNCHATDLDFSGKVDSGDLKILVRYWLDATGP
jgi:hypothetical protein